jgi:hypothetical protein
MGSFTGSTGETQEYRMGSVIGSRGEVQENQMGLLKLTWMKS